MKLQEAYVAGFGDNRTLGANPGVYSSFRPGLFIVGYRTRAQAEEVGRRADALKANRAQLFEAVTVLDAVRTQPEKDGLVQGNGPSDTCYR